MAVTYVGATSDPDWNSGNTAVNIPTGDDDDTLIYLTCGYDGDGTLDAGQLSDFAEVGIWTTGGSTPDTFVGIWDRECDGTESTSYTTNHDSGNYGENRVYVRLTKSRRQPAPATAVTTQDHDIPAFDVHYDGSIAVATAAGYNNAAPVSTWTGDGWTQIVGYDGDYLCAFYKEVDAGSYAAVPGTNDGSAMVALAVYAPYNEIATDDFNNSGDTPAGSYTDGSTLGSTTDWETYTRSGSGDPTFDDHDDHSDGTMVVDVSAAADTESVYQTAMGATDHWAEVDVFLDTDSDTHNEAGPMVRLSSATPDGTLDGYAATMYRTTGTGTVVRISRIDNGARTLLATSSDLSATYSLSDVHTLRLEVVGSTLTLYVNGNEELSTTDSTYTDGTHVGFQLDRGSATTTSQPFVDNFSAGDWTTAAPPASITDYIVEYRTTAGPGVWTSFTDGVSALTGATVTGLSPGVSYDFRVAAVNPSGIGLWSNIVTVTAGSSGTVNFYLGDTQLIGLALGDTSVAKAYLGDINVL